MPIVQSLSRQTFPVLVNEVFTRTLFFAIRLTQELIHTEDVENINWDRIVPFGNRDIERVLAVSTMTLSVADTADAAIRAGIDSCGEAVVFSTRFVTRFNYVAAGRSLFAVYKEISSERKEAELIRQKQLLTEEKNARALEILQKYQEELENRISEYLAEDITEFLQGFECMDQGLTERNSDLVIKGNVTIQRVLGREPQFTNQQEFDDLMDSDIPLIL